MKRVLINTSKRILPILVFICAQATAWASDTTTVRTHKSDNIFTHPWIWIAIVVVSIIVLLGPLDSGRDYRVTMKKKTTDQKMM